MDNETITEAEIWADLDAVFSLQERKPGDIDASDIAERYRVHVNAARQKMEQMVKNGGWEKLKVRDENAGNGWRYVIRKMK